MSLNDYGEYAIRKSSNTLYIWCAESHSPSLPDTLADIVGCDFASPLARSCLLQLGLNSFDFPAVYANGCTCQPLRAWGHKKGH
jgi:hypothetical protein